MGEQKAILSFLEGQAKGQCIGLSEAQGAARTFNCSLRHIEETALSHALLPARYTRNGLNCSDQLKLLQAKVAIIGCGGLGARTAELLTRIGIGHLILTDPDIFAESNLNRQIFCTVETLGQKKVECVADALQKINPALQTTRHPRQFDALSISTADIVIDGLDSPRARKELSTLCIEHSVPMIHGAVKEWYGQIGVEHAASGLIDILYRQQRIRPPLQPHVLAMTVSLIASLQAAEVCKLLLGTGVSLDAGWLQCDLLHNDYEKMQLFSETLKKK